MPKPSFSNSKHAWVKDVSKSSSETNFHYNRDRKRVTFKSNKYGPKKDLKDWGTACREYLLDEDVDMGITAGSSRLINKKFNRNNRKGKGYGGAVLGGKRPLLEGPNNWYRVQVSNWVIFSRKNIGFPQGPTRISLLLQKLNYSFLC